jgi:excisionase family DNA binding protein
VLTVEEAGDRLGVGKRTIYRLIANGDLRVVNVAVRGTRMRVREDDLAAFIDNRTVDAADLADADVLAAGA